MSLGLSAQDSSGGFASELNLVPQPQSISPQGAPWRLPPSLYLHLPTSPLPGIRARAQIAVGQLEDLGMRTQLMASETLEPNQALLTNSPTVPRAWIKVGRPLRGAARKPEGYRLTIRDDGALIEASDENGFYYAAQTIQQLLENRQDMPGLVIEDGPLLPHRAVHLDFKGWPPTRSYLETTLDRLSHYRFNIVILEYEDYFLYNSQPGLSHPKALPPNYIVEIDTLAKERGITLVPLLHGLGNVGYILKLDPYRELREDPRYLQMFCPSHPSTLEIFTAMVEDLLACHSAPLFHIGGDPARFLGQCPACQARARQLGGRSALYLDHFGKASRYLISRGKSVLMWDERVREMTDEQIRWLPPEVCLCLNEATGLGGRTGQPLLVALDRYRNLDRKVWGTAVRQPSFKYDAFDSLDAWAEAADLGYITGLVSAGWTREYSMGPLHEPPELAWPALLYASERAWGGMKNTHRQAFYSRFGARFHGLKEKAQQDRFWAVYDMHLREYPREAREVLHDLYEQCARHRSVLTLVDAWSSIGAFLYYVEHFDQAVASDFGNLQAGTADPFQAGRLRWRVEDLKAKTGDLVEHFRNACQHMSLPESAEEYLNCKMAYGLRRLDQLQEVLEAYPLPETDWQQPVRV